MSSKRANSLKGRKVEVFAMQVLQDAGYTVHRTVRNAVRIPGGWMSNSNDVFGVIDLIAKRPDTKTKWIQVTMGSNIGAKVAGLRSVPWNAAHDEVEIWRWVPGGGKHLDARTGLPRRTLYFQVYRMDENFCLVHDEDHRRQARLRRQDGTATEDA